MMTLNDGADNNNGTIYLKYFTDNKTVELFFSKMRNLRLITDGGYVDRNDFINLHRYCFPLNCTNILLLTLNYLLICSPVY